MANNTDSILELAICAKTELLITKGLDRASNKPKNDGSLTLPDLKTATPMISNKEFIIKAINN